MKTGVAVQESDIHLSLAITYEGMGDLKRAKSCASLCLQQRKQIGDDVCSYSDVMTFVDIPIMLM